MPEYLYADDGVTILTADDGVTPLTVDTGSIEPAVRIIPLVGHRSVVALIGSLE